MNISFWQGYDGTFTELGILGTFVGLTVGLNGIDMTSPNIEILKGGNRELSNFKINLQNLSALVEEMFPRRKMS